MNLMKTDIEKDVWRICAFHQDRSREADITLSLKGRSADRAVFYGRVTVRRPHLMPGLHLASCFTKV